MGKKKEKHVDTAPPATVRAPRKKKPGRPPRPPFSVEHKAACGDVGATGEHGDLGSNGRE